MIDIELLQTQTDPRWVSTIMTGKLTIKGYGCLVTSISNILRCQYPELSQIMSPKELDTFLDNNGGYM